MMRAFWTSLILTFGISLVLWYLKPDGNSLLRAAALAFLAIAIAMIAFGGFEGGRQ